MKCEKRQAHVELLACEVLLFLLALNFLRVVELLLVLRVQLNGHRSDSRLALVELAFAVFQLGISSSELRLEKAELDGAALQFCSKLRLLLVILHLELSFLLSQNSLIVSSTSLRILPPGIKLGVLASVMSAKLRTLREKMFIVLEKSLKISHLLQKRCLFLAGRTVQGLLSFLVPLLSLDTSLLQRGNLFLCSRLLLAGLLLSLSTSLLQLSVASIQCILLLCSRLQ